MGLAGNEPATVDIDSIPGFIRDVETRERLLLARDVTKSTSRKMTECVFTTAICRCMKTGCRSTRHDDTVIYSKTYYSIGGGFIVDEEHFGRSDE